MAEDKSTEGEEMVGEEVERESGVKKLTRSLVPGPEWHREVRFELPEVIDLDQIRLCRQICDKTHGRCCQDRNSEYLSRYLETLTLIDTETASLVVEPTSTHYVALSYDWGVKY
jgi:hypothetical protein